MNHISKLNSRSKIQWWTMSLILVIVLAFAACEKNEVEDEEEEYPSLIVKNQLNDSWRSIYAVSLVGYDFENLNIEPNGDSQAFILDGGMAGGYEDINVTVRYSRYSGVGASTSIKVNFVKGKSTTISLTGCSGAEGCPGISLE